MYLQRKYIKRIIREQNIKKSFKLTKKNIKTKNNID